MIYIRLAGGLGNQLFQIAAALVVSKATNQFFMPIADALSDYSEPRTPDFMRLVSCSRLQLDDGVSLNKHLRWLVAKGRAGRILPILGVNDWVRHPISIAFTKRWGGFMDGYFQHGWSEARFSEVLSELILKPHESSSIDYPAVDECVVHMRGRDFRLLPLHNILDSAYFLTAISRARECGWKRFAVVSDDHTYARGIVDCLVQQIPKLEIRLLPPNHDLLDDFAVLRNSSARIIGNSSFAWWATALDEKQSPTWSPTKFIRGKPRDFFLKWEIQIQV